MKTMTLAFLLLAALSLAMVAASVSPAASPADTIVVDSTADSGPGTLRQALLDAQSGDTITFDPTVFPPSAPVTISVTSELPGLWRGNQTIDASNAGVILDGSSVPGEWVGGLQIVSSHGNIIRGLRVSNFSGVGIAISGGAYNTIGGDRSVGAGPFGQGNLLTHNDAGIGLWGDGVCGASFNTMSGNLIGSDAAGLASLGNSQGIMIMEGSSDNTIGPHNVVAHNHGNGISVKDPDSMRNTITGNSIHENGGNGIRLWGAAEQKPVAPLIFTFDLAAGSVSGATCCGCTVEVFSDDSDEGAIYEGRTTADRTGYFTFFKGASLVGPHLTATMTDPDGRTSEFSLPTSNASRSLTLQHGNDVRIAQFRARQSAELPDNRIGVQFDSYQYPELSDLTMVYPRGMKRLRTAINGLEPEGVNWDKPELSVDPSHDDVFTRMAGNSITITYVMVFWDKATYPGGEGLPCPRFKTQAEIDNYLGFVRFIVDHFKDRVDYFEIWNEPDVTGLCTKSIEVPDYVNLVEQAVPVIQAEDPEAKIVIGGVANTMSPGASGYLFDILESPIVPLVDVVAWHPFYGASPGYEYYRDYYYGYPAFVQEIKDVATAHGFEGEYQADEINYSTPATASPDQPYVYSPTIALKYSGRAIVMHLGMDVGVGLGGGSGRVGRNLCTVMAGAEPIILPVQIQTTVTDTVVSVAAYTFSSPNDQRLVALWTDGIAKELDPGITTTVTIPGLVGHTVTGIDVLHGFEQPLITSEEDGGLVIRDLLVKDYPIILRVSPIVSPALLAISGPTTGLVDATYTFTATVDPITVTTPITYSWQATGRPPVAHAESLTVTDSVSFAWATGGNKGITVTARNAGGTVTSTHLVTIYQPPVADFAAAPTSGIAPLTVAFTNTSQGEFGTSLWDFGDGVTGTLHSPSHTYTTPGAYTVTLAVSGPGGVHSMMRSNFVTVYEPVNASFTASPTSGPPPLTVAFSNTSTGDYADSLWQFGDGVTSTLGSPTHTYTAVGAYTVTLSINGPGGEARHTKAAYITVEPFEVYLPLVTRGG